MRTVRFQFDSLQLSMNFLEDRVRHLDEDGCTEFLGRNRNNFRTSKSNLPKGMKSKIKRR